MSSFQASANLFYIDSQVETVVDPQSAVVQNHLLEELRRCDHLVQLDLRYANIVAGASKMPMNMIWAARNQDESVSDTDLAALKDLAWNEFVKKRYLPSVSGSTTVSETAASMLEIVQSMQLQRRRFQIMGLHEQVEASEIHLILQLCQARILHTDKYRETANRFRRHDRLFEPFALAVGAFVCSSAPYTLGAATTRYERDLQFEFRKNATALFVYALKEVSGPIGAGLEEDYVARISRLIVVRPDDGSKSIGVRPKDDHPDDSSAILNSVAVAQSNAEKAWTEVVRVKEQLDTKEKVLDAKLKERDQELRVFLLQTLHNGGEGAIENVRAAYARVRDEMMGHVDAALAAQRGETERVSKTVQGVQANQERTEKTLQDIEARQNATAKLVHSQIGATDEFRRRLTDNEQRTTAANDALNLRITALTPQIDDTIRRRLDAVDFGSVTQRVLNLENAQAETSTRVNKELEEWKARITAIEARPQPDAGVTGRMDAIEGKMRTLEEQARVDGGVRERLDRLEEQDLKQEVDDMKDDFNTRYGLFEQTITDLQKRLSQIEDRVQRPILEEDGHGPDDDAPDGGRKRKQPDYVQEKDLEPLVERVVRRLVDDTMVADIMERVRRAVAEDRLRAPPAAPGEDLAARVQALERLIGTDETVIAAEYIPGAAAGDALYGL